MKRLADRTVHEFTLSPPEEDSEWIGEKSLSVEIHYEKARCTRVRAEARPYGSAFTITAKATALCTVLNLLLEEGALRFDNGKLVPGDVKP